MTVSRSSPRGRSTSTTARLQLAVHREGPAKRPVPPGRLVSDTPAVRLRDCRSEGSTESGGRRQACPLRGRVSRKREANRGTYEESSDRSSETAGWAGQIRRSPKAVRRCTPWVSPAQAVPQAADPPHDAGRRRDRLPLGHRVRSQAVLAARQRAVEAHLHGADLRQAVRVPGEKSCTAK